MFSLNNKEILVTGGAGFLGKHLICKLKQLGVEEDNITIPIFPECDLRKMEDCLSVTKGIDVVFHLAGIVGGIGFNKKHPGKVFYDNASMALNLIEASRLQQVGKFVGIGSVCEYPKFTQSPFKEKDLWKGYPEETNASYGLAKKFMLVQSQAYREEYGLNIIHLLMLNLYGPGDNFDSETSHVIPALIKKINIAKKENMESVDIWGSGNATRGFLYVEDAAEGILLAAQKYNNAEPMNLGSSMEISIKDLAKLICELMNFQGNIKWDTTKPDGQLRRCLDISKAQKEIGFEEKHNFRKGLKKTIEWYLENN